MKTIFVGGGTGGHVYPALAIAEELQEEIIDSQILFIGSDDGIENSIVPKERLTIVTIRSRAMLRKLSYKALSSPFLAIAGFFQSIKILKDFRPDIVIGTGGFVCLPVLLAAFFLRVPTLIHEANVVPGITTRICKWFVSRILISYDASRKYFRFRKVFDVGVPVRRSVFKTVKSIAIQNLGLRQDKKILLVLGGSQGARSINNTIVEALPVLSELDLQIIHISGDRDHDQIAEKTKGQYPLYRLLPYMHNIWDALAAADLVITRAGSIALAEITARGIPSIIIPFPFSSEKHQDRNAKVLVDKRAAVLINDSELTALKLSDEVKRLLTDRPLYLTMATASKSLARPDAAKEIVKIMLNMLGIDLYARKRKKKKQKA